MGLHDITLFDLDTNPVACGYTIVLTGWDRTLWCDFDYGNNLVTRCVGCRHTTDIWGFSYTP